MTIKKSNHKYLINILNSLTSTCKKCKQHILYDLKQTKCKQQHSMYNLLESEVSTRL